MAETDWFNKPVENSRELILKEAFKLFLQKNVEKVTVPELERHYGIYLIETIRAIKILRLD